MRRARWIALAVVPVLLLAGDFLYWRSASDRLRGEFDAWTLKARAAGWDLRHGAVTLAGWPSAASLRVDNVSIRGAGRADSAIRNLEWGSDRLLLRTRLTRPDLLEITVGGVHPLQINSGPPIPVTADDMHIRLALRLNGPPRSIEVEAANLFMSLPGTERLAGTERLGVGNFNARADLHADPGRDKPVVNFTFSAQPVSLPHGVHWGLGPEIREVTLAGVVNGPLPAGPGLAARATSWRDEGGSLELHRIAVDWGPSRLEGTATLALDEELQPMGTGAAKIAGYGAALDALAENAVLTRSAAKAAKAVLSLLAESPADGKPEEVEVPLTLQFRTLSVRQVPLVRLPEVEWPGR